MLGKNGPIHGSPLAAGSRNVGHATISIAEGRAQRDELIKALESNFKNVQVE